MDGKNMEQLRTFLERTRLLNYLLYIYIRKQIQSKKWRLGVTLNEKCASYENFFWMRKTFEHNYINKKQGVITYWGHKQARMSKGVSLELSVLIVSYFSYISFKLFKHTFFLQERFIHLLEYLFKWSRVLFFNRTKKCQSYKILYTLAMV